MPIALRRVLAVVVLAAFVGVMPTTAVMNAAEPVTLADWLRQIFVTPDRKIDHSTAGLAAAPTPPPPVMLQNTSEQTPPKVPVDRSRLPDGWLQSLRSRGRRRRRRR